MIIESRKYKLKLYHWGNLIWHKDYDIKVGQINEIKKQILEDQKEDFGFGTQGYNMICIGNFVFKQKDLHFEWQEVQPRKWNFDKYSQKCKLCGDIGGPNSFPYAVKLGMFCTSCFYVYLLKYHPRIAKKMTTPYLSKYMKEMYNKYEKGYLVTFEQEIRRHETN